MTPNFQKKKAPITRSFLDANDLMLFAVERINIYLRTAMAGVSFNPLFTFPYPIQSFELGQGSGCTGVFLPV